MAPSLFFYPLLPAGSRPFERLDFPARWRDVDAFSFSIAERIPSRIHQQIVKICLILIGRLVDNKDSVTVSGLGIGKFDFTTRKKYSPLVRFHYAGSNFGQGVYLLSFGKRSEPFGATPPARWSLRLGSRMGTRCPRCQNGPEIIQYVRVKRQSLS